MVTTKQKLMAILAHLGWFSGVGFIFAPLLIYLFYKDDEFVGFHAKQALGMQLGFAVLSTIVSILCALLIGVLLLPILFVIAAVLGVCSLWAVWKVANDQLYVYPVIGEFINRA